MPIKILTIQQKKEIENLLKKQFGIEKVPGLILKVGKERLFYYVGSLSVKEIYELEKTIPIERVGVYIGKEQNNEIRLSIEGTHLFKKQITKNIFELGSEQTNLWMHGSEILLDDILPKETKLKDNDNNQSTRGGRPGLRGGRELKKGFVIIKNNNDLLGTGKASAEKITNFIPKSRRLKFKG